MYKALVEFSYYIPAMYLLTVFGFVIKRLTELSNSPSNVTGWLRDPYENNIDEI
jgi:hypothetical protein